MLGVGNTVKEKLIQSHKGLCLVEQFSTQHGKTSPFLVTDSVSSSVFAHSLAQQHLQGGQGPLYCFNYKFLPGLPNGNYIFWVILRGCSKSRGALESDSPGLRSSSSTSLLSKLLTLSKAVSPSIKGESNSTYLQHSKYFINASYHYTVLFISHSAGGTSTNVAET